MRSGILLVPRPTDRAPSIREVPVEVHPTSVLPGAGAEPVGVQVADHPEVDGGRRRGDQGTCAPRSPRTRSRGCTPRRGSPSRSSGSPRRNAMTGRPCTECPSTIRRTTGGPADDSRIDRSGVILANAGWRPAGRLNEPTRIEARMARIRRPLATPVRSLRSFSSARSRGRVGTVRVRLHGIPSRGDGVSQPQHERSHADRHQDRERDQHLEDRRELEHPVIERCQHDRIVSQRECRPKARGVRSRGARGIGSTRARSVARRGDHAAKFPRDPIGEDDLHEVRRVDPNVTTRMEPPDVSTLDGR